MIFHFQIPLFCLEKNNDHFYQISKQVLPNNPYTNKYNNWSKI